MSSIMEVPPRVAAAYFALSDGKEKQYQLDKYGLTSIERVDQMDGSTIFIGKPKPYSMVGTLIRDPDTGEIITEDESKTSRARAEAGFKVMPGMPTEVVDKLRATAERAASESDRAKAEVIESLRKKLTGTGTGKPTRTRGGSAVPRTPPTFKRASTEGAPFLQGDAFACTCTRQADGNCDHILDMFRNHKDGRLWPVTFSRFEIFIPVGRGFDQCKIIVRPMEGVEGLYEVNAIDTWISTRKDWNSLVITKDDGLWPAITTLHQCIVATSTYEIITQTAGNGQFTKALTACQCRLHDGNSVQQFARYYSGANSINRDAYVVANTFRILVSKTCLPCWAKLSPDFSNDAPDI